MKEDFGSDFISITDEEGNEFELELLDVLEKDDIFYHAFIPASTGKEGEEEDIEIVILKTVEEDGEELLATLDSEEELTEVYELFIERLFEDGDEET